MKQMDYFKFLETVVVDVITDIERKVNDLLHTEMSGNAFILLNDIKYYLREAINNVYNKNNLKKRYLKFSKQKLYAKIDRISAKANKRIERIERRISNG